MLYHIFYPLRDLWFGFNVFKYITFRMAAASVCAFLVSILLGPKIISFLKHLCPSPYAQDVRTDRLPHFYQGKTGIPTMGGVLVIASVFISVILWARIENYFVLTALASMAWLGAIGFIDDWQKIKQKGATGLGARTKFLGQLIFALCFGTALYFHPHWEPVLHIPFLKEIVINMGILYIGFIMIVIVGSSNAVNLTDGLDGLAIGCTVMVALAFSAISYATSHNQIADYLNIVYIPQASEIAVFCAALVGASLGFLWFNAHPAEIFMGDTGALSIGGVIGVIAVLLRKELLLVIAGGIFVLETLSVLLQILYFKRTGKRLFRMSPLHHHFQLKGIPETKITIRFWIVGIIFAIVAVISLKLR